MEIFTEYFAQWNLLYLGVFFAFFITALMQDIYAHEGKYLSPNERAKDGFKWTLIWIGVSIAFGGVTYLMLGGEMAAAYFTGWGLEKALALDNLFAIMAVMAAFGLLSEDKLDLQYKILHWGILGAIFFRVIFLATGAFFVNLPTWSIGGLDVNIVFILFALVILWTVTQMWGEAFNKDDDDEDEIDYVNHWSVRFVKKFFPVEPSIESRKFFVTKMRDNNSSGTLTYVTPLFLCLICVEVFDVIFAFDSMPVIVAVVKDPNVMITSTLMACAGLRAFYFCLEALKSMFCHLDKAVVLVLLYIVVKLIVTAFGFHMPNLLSLAIVGGLISAGIFASLIWPEEDSDELASS